MKALILDTETTGTGDDAQLIEAGYMQVGDNFEQNGIVSGQRFLPSIPIEFGAMAVHHIAFSDLTGCPPPSEFKLPADVDYLIGHNIDFDWKMIGSPDIKRICTLALARSIWPDTAHSQGALLYYHLGVEAREILKDAHSAVADVKICHQILGFILKEITMSDGAPISIHELWRVSEKARIPTVMPFGKHKDKPIEKVPLDYVNWLLKQDDVDPYLRTALTKR